MVSQSPNLSSVLAGHFFFYFLRLHDNDDNDNHDSHCYYNRVLQIHTTCAIEPLTRILRSPFLSSSSSHSDSGPVLQADRQTETQGSRDMAAQQQPLATATTSGMAGQNVGANGNGTGTAAKKPEANYRGFVAGIFSGIAKLSGMFLHSWLLVWLNWKY